MFYRLKNLRSKIISNITPITSQILKFSKLAAHRVKYNFRRRIVLILVVLLIVPASFYTIKWTSDRALASWYDTSWTYRQNLYFNNATVAENLTNFPVMVKLTASNFDYSKIQADCDDIRFVDADNTTNLDYEIEKCNTSGDSFFWVEVPQIDQSSNNDFIYMYYGNSSATSGENETGTWDSANVGRWHLNENGNDSTSNNNIGTLKNGVDCTVSGKFGSACDFDGVDDYVNVGSDASLDIVGDMTIDFWIKPNTLPTSTNIGFIAKRPLTGGAARWHFGINDDLSGYNFYNGVAEYQSSERPGVGVWSHVVMVLDSGTDVKYYENGTLVDTIAGASIGSATGDPVTIGRSGVDALFNGAIDDVRIYNTALTASEVKTLYNGGSSLHMGYQTGADPSTSLDASEVGTPPIAYWDFNERSGSSVFDKSGNGNTGTWAGTGSHWVGQGKYGPAGSFDGVDDYVDAGDNDDTDGVSALTLSTWFRANTLGANEGIVVKGTGSTSRWGIMIDGTPHA